MNIYSVASYFYNEKECDNIWTINYILHEKVFSKDEFHQMCKVGLETILDKNAFELEEFLVLNYNFKKIESLVDFEFEEQ